LGYAFTEEFTSIHDEVCTVKLHINENARWRMAKFALWGYFMVIVFVTSTMANFFYGCWNLNLRMEFRFLLRLVLLEDTKLKQNSRFFPILNSFVYQ
jgi:hypothetical protein